MNKILNIWNSINDTFEFRFIEFFRGAVIIVLLYWVSVINYILFHSLIEIFCVVIIFGIFIIVWNARIYFTNHFVLFLGIAYLFISLIDILHVLSYQGVGVFNFFDVTNNLSTQLWIAARYIQAISLLIAPIYFIKKLNVRFVFESYSLITLLLLVSIFYLRIFPTAYIQDVGLTMFKIISEYIISLILFLAVIFLINKRKGLEKKVFYYILTSIIFSLMSELLFTSYFSTFSFSNILGHYFRMISFLLIYRTTIEFGVVNPLSFIFKNLERDTQIIKASELKFRSLTELSISAIVLTNSSGVIELWNGAAKRIFGWDSDEMIGKTMDVVFPEEKIHGDKFSLKTIVDDKDLSKANQTIESSGKRKSGEIFPLEISFSYWKVKDDLFYCYMFRDISSRRKTQKDLAQKKKRLENLVNDLKIFKMSMDKAFAHMVITDNEGIIVYANKAAEEITGFSHEEIIGQTPSLWGRQMSKEFYEEFWRIIKIEKKNYAGEITNKRKDGTLYQTEIRVSPVLDKSGDVEFFVAIERDITEEREMDKAKTEFISLAAHQLRTPLSTISLTTELLLKGIDGEMSKENKKYLRGIFSEVKDMTEMIEIFLNVSRIEMGKFPIETERMSIYSVIDDIVSKILPQFKDKKIHFKRDYDRNLPVINLDQKVMKIILENLLSNAIKYTPVGGQIILSVENDRNHIYIRVKDNGIGIPTSQQNKIFTKMFRANNVSTIKSDGSGLGLYLVKNLAVQCGYDISFISNINTGTTFTLSIPKKDMVIKKKFVGISNSPFKYNDIL